MLGNSGYRAPTRFCLYRKVRDWVEGDHYTRIRGVIGRGCAWTPNGRRCGIAPFRGHYRLPVS